MLKQKSIPLPGDKKKGKKQAPKRYAAPAVKQAGDILFCLAGNEAAQMSLAEICFRVGVSGSKAFGILEALQESGLVKRGKDGKGYALGPGLVTLSRKVLDDLTPSQLAEPILEELAKATGSTAVLGLIAGRTVYIAAKRESAGDIRTVVRVGTLMPVSFGAHGKAIAAFLGEEGKEMMLRDGNPDLHGNPVKLDPVRLTKELAECRRTGYACDSGETTRGINVIAAPVMDAGGKPMGIVEIFVLASPDTVPGLGPLVAEAGRVLSRQLGAEIG